MQTYTYWTQHTHSTTPPPVWTCKFTIILFSVFCTFYRNERRILYSNYLHRPKIFFFTSVAAGIQFMFLTYLSSKAVIKQTSNSSSFKWRVGLSAVSLLVSTLFAYTAMVYPLRTVNKMVFNIRRSTIELSTYTPFGKVHTKEVMN